MLSFNMYSYLLLSDDVSPSQIPLTVSRASSSYSDNGRYKSMYLPPLALSTPISMNHKYFWVSATGDYNPWIILSMSSSKEVVMVEVTDRQVNMASDWSTVGILGSHWSGLLC